MATLKFSVPHDLTEAEALKRIKAFSEKTKKKYSSQVTDLKESWKGNTGTVSATVQGFALRGTVRVSSPTIDIEGEVPFALSFLKGKMERMILAEAKKILKK